MNQIGFSDNKERQYQNEDDKTQVRLQDKDEYFNQLKYCRSYNKEIRPSIQLIIIFMYQFHLINILISYKIITKDNDLLDIDIQPYFHYINSTISYIIFIPTIFIKITIIITSILDHKYYHIRQSYKILYYFIEYLRKYQRLLVQIDLYYSSLFLISSTPISFFNFIISIIIIIFTLIFLQNYSFRKDIFYVGSVQYYFILRLSMLVGSLINFTAIIFQNHIVSQYLFIIIHIIISGRLLIGYITDGCTLYRPPILRYGIFIYVNAYISLSINLFAQSILYSKDISFILHFIITMSICILYCHNELQKKKYEMIQNKSNIQLETQYLLQITQSSFTDDEDKILIYGLLVTHMHNQCNNIYCFVNNHSLYDSKKRQMCTKQNIKVHYQSLIKLYIKCRYQTYLSEFITNFDVILAYSQFLYNQFSNISLCLFWLNKLTLNNQHLGLTQKIKLNGLISKIKQDNNYLCQLVYNNLEIQNLIEGEQINMQINSIISGILNRKLNICRLIGQPLINLSTIKTETKQIMSHIDYCQNKLKVISNYIQNCQRWKLQYLCFALFFKNQRLKNNSFSEFSSAYAKQYPNKNINIIDASNLLDENSCCIHTEIYHDELLIKRVSNNFEGITAFNKNEVINASIDILLPSIYANEHKSMIIKLSKEGHFTNENIYTIKQVFIKHKSEHIIAVNKLYKEFVTQRGELQYVCFLRKTDNNQAIFLCNQKYQITDYTPNLINILSREDQQLLCMKGINIISLIPNLVTLTSFQLFKNNPILNQDLMQGNTFQLTNFEFYYPLNSIQTFTTIYQDKLKSINPVDMQLHYQLISIITDKIKSSFYSTYKCSATIREFNNYNMKFYQIKLTKIYMQKSLNITSSQFNEKIKEYELSKSIDYNNLLEQINKSQWKQDLSTQSNIFIKEQGNLPPLTNIYIFYLKWLWVAFIFSLIIVTILNILLLDRCFTKITQQYATIHSITSISIAASRITNLYLTSTLGYPFDKQKAENITQQINLLTNQPIFRSIIFDPVLRQDSYHNFSIQYNNIDLIYVIQSAMRTLFSNNKIDVQDLEYSVFMANQIPLQQFLNHTKIRTKMQFQNYNNSIDIQFIIIFTTTTILGILFFTAIALNSHKFSTSMIQVMKISCLFNHYDIQKIIKYFQDMLIVFQDLSQLRQGNYNQIRLGSHGSSNRNKNKQINLNTKTKQVIVGRGIYLQKFIYLIKIIICIIFVAIILLSANLYFKNSINNNIKLFNTGFIAFQEIPSLYLSAQILAHFINSSTIPYLTYQVYSTIIDNIQAVSNEGYEELPFGEFNNKCKQFYLENLCDIYSMILSQENITKQYCSNIADRSFENGVRQYSNYQYKTLMKYEIINENINMTEIEQYLNSIEIYNIFNKRWIQDWMDEYRKLRDDSLFEIHLLSGILIFIIIVVIVFVNRNIFHFLRNQYIFYQYFYDSMMPQYIVSSQKIIKSRLTVIHFL